MNKLIKDGKVAVVIHTGGGFGWSTMYKDHAEYLVFDAAIARAVLDGDHAEVWRLVQEAQPNIYGISSYEGLEVVWVNEGAKFKVLEYDGYESILTVDDFEFTA